MTTRREFLRDAAIGAAGVVVGQTARSYARVMGANDRVNCAVIGLHGRGYAHLEAIAVQKNAAVTHVCDVDRRELEKFAAVAEHRTHMAPSKATDFRKLLALRDLDAVTIATPEHWHTPMAIMALEAGKHVYVEKPPSHNPYEGALLVQAQQRHGKLVQMGNQQRSSPHTIDIIRKIHEGLIGRPYFGKAWYTNTRGSIGRGKEMAPPPELDWELWQGPAPRQPYKDNIHPYNWHWFWRWGTGETLNNGTHEVDLCIWALQAGFPHHVAASGGRYHFTDDWEFYDTLVTSYQYDGKLITWEGLSCQGKQQYGRSRGAAIHGTEGTVIVDRDGYDVFTLDDKKRDSYRVPVVSTTRDLVSIDAMTNEHMRNFIDGIRLGEALRSPIREGNVSVTMLQLSNIAWKVGRTLQLDPKDGHILNDPEAEGYWKREYAKGWEL